MSWLYVTNDTTEFWMFVNHWDCWYRVKSHMWRCEENKDKKERTSRSKPESASFICLLYLMFQSPSFLLFRLHSPPPQSNWFRSTSWGGYGVGVWAFCFHLSVNPDWEKKGSTSTATWFPEVTEVFIRAGGRNAKKTTKTTKKTQTAVWQKCLCANERTGLQEDCGRLTYGGEEEEEDGTRENQEEFTWRPPHCSTLSLRCPRTALPLLPWNMEDKEPKATSHSIHSAEREGEREGETGGCPH